MEDRKSVIEQGRCVLGIEFGSTRIKASLVDDKFEPIAAGDHAWENRLENGIWTYHYEDIISGLQDCYRSLKDDVSRKYGVTLKRVGCIGISGMMHGYIPLDEEQNPLTEFRTWRNTITGEAAMELTEAFDFNIPQRWSIAHLYQAVLNKESHLDNIYSLTTLAGYIHYRLTGRLVVGIGEGSGIFPIDTEKGTYDEQMMKKMNELCQKHMRQWDVEDMLPRLLPAGSKAGILTAEGAKLLDPDGDLEVGIPFAPPEGDAGTGMVATNSVRVRTGNVSAGTSDFAMVVVDRKLEVHREIDMVTTPAGAPVAMVHCNNCTSDINAWVQLLAEFSGLVGGETDMGKIFPLLFNKAMEGDKDCGGLLSFNYFSGEGVTNLDAGKPLFLRRPDAKFTLANFMRTHIMSALATLKLGLDILTKEEMVVIDKMYGHGGFFKTPGVGQSILAAAVDAPISVMETAGEGGPYGMALLSAYTIWGEEDETLEEFLEHKVFKDANSTTLTPDSEDVRGFNQFAEAYKEALAVEREAIKVTC